MARYPERRLSVALLCNTDEVPQYLLAHRVADLFLTGVDPLPAARAVRLPAPALAAKAGLYRNLRTGEALSLVAEKDALRVESGAPLVALSPSRFQIGEPDTIGEFEAGEGERPRRLRVERTGEGVEEYEPVERAEPRPEGLEPLAGVYWCGEAEALLAVVVEDGVLKLRRRPFGVLTLKPLWADAWQSPIGLLRFLRDPEGRVSELSVTLPRVRDLRCRRVETTASDQ